MVMPAPKSLTPITTDPTTQKLADLEARIAQLESALIISSSGTVTLKSGSNIVIQSASNVTIKSMSQTSVEASSTLTLKGSTINLN